VKARAIIGGIAAVAALAAVATLLPALTTGCQGELVTVKYDVGRPDARITWKEGGTIQYDLGKRDGKGYLDAQHTEDATTKPGHPCTYGKCAKDLICMANVCHKICSTECGDKAPECKATEGCHWITSFSAACMPGTAQYDQKCGGGVWCVGGNLCVNVSGKGTKCLRLCKYGCAAGAYCSSTNNGCKVCIK
jgi:hypothetical protein